MEGAVDVCVVGRVGGVGAGEGGGGAGASAVHVGGARAVEVESLVGGRWGWGRICHFGV